MSAQITRAILRKRLRHGWSIDRALSQRPRQRLSHRLPARPPCPYLAALAAWRLPAGYLEPGVRGNMRVGL